MHNLVKQLLQAQIPVFSGSRALPYRPVIQIFFGLSIVRFENWKHLPKSCSHRKRKTARIPLIPIRAKRKNRTKLSKIIYLLYLQSRL